MAWRGCYSYVKYGLLALALGAVSAQGAGLEAAGANRQAQLEEVIVTARLRAEPLQDVPISVSSFQGEALETMAIRTFEELSYSVPNLTVNETPIDTNIFIRGIGSPENQGFEQSVGMFQDGIYWGRARQARAPFFDVQRIEVLKGPQGILFGKNTSAGAINIVTANPSETTEGYASVYYEPDADELVLEGILSGALTPNLYGRLSLRSATMDGWVDNTSVASDEPERDEFAGRGTLLWDARDDIEVIFKYGHGKLDVTGNSMQVTNAGDFGPLFAAFDPAFEARLNDQRSVGGQGVFIHPEKSDTDSDTASLTLNWQLGEHKLSAITGYSAYDFDDVFDADISALSQAQKVFNSDFDQWSQEVRLFSPTVASSGMEYVIGAYWQDTDLDVNTRDDIDLGALGAPAGSRYYVTDQSSTVGALFGQATWHFDERLRINAGLRWTNEDKDAKRFLQVTDLGTDIANPALEPFFAVALGTFPHDLKGSREEDHWLPSVSVQWDIADNAMLYASYSRGYKGGGFDEQLTSGDPDDWEFEDETADAFELGAKMRLFEDRAELNAALFYTEYDDLQVSAFDGIAGFVVGNAAQATTQGLELDGRFRIMPSLTVVGALAVLDAQYDDYKNAPCTAQQTQDYEMAGGAPPCLQDLSGDRPMYSPKWAGNLFLEYYYAFGDFRAGGYELRSVLEINATDDFFLSQDLDPNLEQDAFTKVNLRIGLSSLARGWEIALVGKNLSDKQTASFGNDVPILNGAFFEFADRPRTVAVQGIYRF